jgi:1,2-diacylglycerol 3-beta-galactosyltransferase
MRAIDLVWFNAGGGHRAAATALESAIHARELPWCVRKVNLTAVLDPTGLFQRVFGIEPEDIYNKRLATGFTLGLRQELKVLQRLIGLAHTSMVERLAEHWRATRPDLVVSLIPNFNRALYDGLALGCPGVPFVTVMTDMADHPPNFWIEPTLEQHIVCGTDYAVAQAIAAGCPPYRVHCTSGMILRPDFYRSEPVDRVAERARLGIDATTPTGVVLFGGTGSNVMTRIAQRLATTPLILMCGRNAALAAELRAMPADVPRVVVGFTADVAQWMRMADFFIGKPGPGCLSEAVQQRLPVIVTRNSWTMPQERWNTEWVVERDIGVVHRSFRTVQAAVDELVQRLPTLRRNVERIDNQAVFEVPRILETILRDYGRKPTLRAINSRA